MRVPNFIRELPNEAVARVIDLLNQPQIVQTVKDAASQVGATTERGMSQLQDSVKQAKRWIDTMTRRYTAATPAAAIGRINATGRIFAERLSGAPASESAGAAVTGVLCGYVDESAVGTQLHRQLTSLTGAPSVMVLHSVPAAIQCLAMHPAISRGWVVSRAAALRLPDGSDLIAMLHRLGRVIEAGTVNSCSARELSAASTIDGQAEPIAVGTGLLTLLPTSAIATDAHAASIPLEQLFLDHARQAGVPAVEVRYDATLCDLSGTASGTVQVANRLQAGVAAVVFPGDMFIGGPRCGIIAGTEEFLSPLKNLAADFGLYSPPLSAAMLLGALSSNQTSDAWVTTPLGEIWTSSIANQRSRAERLATQIRMSPHVSKVTVGEKSFSIGAPPLERLTLPSITLQIEPAASIEMLMSKLRSGNRPIIALQEGNKLTIAMRTVDPADDQALVRGFGSDEPATADSNGSGDQQAAASPN